MTQTANPSASSAQAAPPPKPAAPKPLRLPEHPKLAPGVRPAGRMRESAFVNPPWLIEREDAGYIQVTELLYRIAELCTGENTAADIAEKITAAGKPVSTMTVQRLLAQLLLPRGLIEAADGSVALAPTRGPSALALRMKLKMVSPRLVDPITQVLRWLYWPPVFLVVLAAAAVVEGWLYFVHGAGASLHDVLYTPALMLPLVLSVVLSAGFHELGHASALRYAGRKVRGMGVGLYLVYPAFYTDVSDNYRLTRWPRIRTDLGGFYFNLIFTLAVIGLFLLTGWEFLLLAIVLVNLEILHQLLPFIRLDGYWALADLTGIPDFFSEMGAFVRSVVPIQAWKGRKLAPLKWWAKAVFAVYLLVTVPLLALLLFLMLRGFPRILATAWDSLGKQGQAFTQGVQTGDAPAVVAAAVQAIFLAIPTLGVALTLFTMARRGLKLLWRWSSPTPMRRVVGTFATAAVAGLVVWLWLPQLPLSFGGSSGSALAETQSSFQPIARDERGTVPDMLAAVGPASPARATASTAATPQATPVATLQAAPGSDRLAQPPTTQLLTPAATAASRPGATPAPTAAAPVATAPRPTSTAAGGLAPDSTATTGSTTPVSTPAASASVVTPVSTAPVLSTAQTAVSPVSAVGTASTSTAVATSGTPADTPTP